MGRLPDSFFVYARHSVLGLPTCGAVGFKQAPLLCHTDSGLPYTRWVAYGMPQLGQYQHLLDTVFFLYPSEGSARAGEDAGGTGFFVAVPSKTFPNQYHHHYAVTNWHVACDGSPVIRVNRLSGPPEVFPFEPHEWSFIPNHHDIAVVPVTLSASTLKVSSMVYESWFLSDKEIKDAEINAGEDVFMLGRFIDYDGVEANCPSMRFGNLSMMAAHVPQPTPSRFAGASYVVDMHSRTGYSGSPVFLYRTTGSLFSAPGKLVVGHMMKLLGILWGQFPEEWDIGDQSKKSKSAKRQAAQIPVLEGKSVKGMSGMVPRRCHVRAILKVLELSHLQEQRASIDAQLHTIFGNDPVKQSVGIDAPETKTA